MAPDTNASASRSVRDRARLVKKSSAVAAVVTAGIVAGLWFALPPITGMDTVLARLVYALRCNAFAVLMLVAGIESVAILRGRSEAIDPLAGKESRAIRVCGNYTENTLQQFVLFFIATMTLATYLDGASMRWIVIHTAVFMLGRLVFWIGYLKDSVLRAPGMSITMAPTILAIAWIVFRILTG